MSLFLTFSSKTLHCKQLNKWQQYSQSAWSAVFQSTAGAVAHHPNPRSERFTKPWASCWGVCSALGREKGFDCHQFPLWAASRGRLRARGSGVALDGAPALTHLDFMPRKPGPDVSHSQEEVCQRISFETRNSFRPLWPRSLRPVFWHYEICFSSENFEI